MHALIPDDNGTAADSFWAGATMHDLSYTGTWSLTVWAICASGVTGHVIVEALDPDNPNETYSYAIAICPGSKKVIGAGGIVYKYPFILNSIYLQPNLHSVIVEGYRSEYGTPNGMGVRAYAVCIDPIPGQQLVQADSGFSSDAKTVSVQCPAGTHVHGTGAWLNGAHGQAYLDAVFPYGPASGVFLNAREDTTGFTGNWSARVFAICAQ